MTLEEAVAHLRLRLERCNTFERDYKGMPRWNTGDRVAAELVLDALVERINREQKDPEPKA
jgi:hypothetical protein